MNRIKLINLVIAIGLVGTTSCKKGPKTSKPIIKTAVTKIIDCNDVPLVFEDLGEGIDYIIGCPIMTRSQVITIEPGVTIQFEGKNAGIEIGSDYFGYSIGALKMIGTATKPIILQGKSATAGSWQGIILNGINPENKWEHVTIRDAGSGEIPAGLLVKNVNNWRFEMSIKNCSFINNLGYGISDYSTSSSTNTFGIFRSFENNNFIHNTKSALRLNISNVGGIDRNSSYHNNGQNYIEVTGITGPKYEVAIKKISIPYLINVQGSLELINKLTLEPGVTLQFVKGSGLSNMYYPEDALIIANGTAESPIVFQGFEPNIKGYWQGIELNNLEPGVFNYCIIDGAGSLAARSGCTSNVKSAIHFGAKCYAQSGRGIVTNSTISNSGGYAITFQSGKDVVIENNKYIGNVASGIHNY